MSSGADFSTYFHETVDHVTDPLSRRMILLMGLGENGARAGFLYTAFRDLGVVHLLVLSGSQVIHFRRAFSKILRLLLPLVRAPVGRRWIHDGAVFLGLWLYGSATGWDAPLTRALLFEMCALACPRLREGFLLLLCLIAQTALFPQHLAKNGFYLSWCASLVLRGAGRLAPGNAWMPLVVTALTQALVVALLKRAWPTAEEACWILFANGVLGMLLETWLMPTLGFALAFAALGCGFPGGLTLLRLQEFLALLMEGASMTLLVALRAIMYIQKR